MDRADICKRLEHKLDKKRYIHTLGVAHTAACLSMSEGEDPDRAFMAGLLHDCAKWMKDMEFLDYCKEYDIAVSDVERANPALLHSKAGAYIAKNEYGVTDEEILSAIRWHTTGRPGMTKLEEIVFIADYIEPNRTHDPELREIRKEAFSDIHKATYHIYLNTMKHLKSSAKTLDPMTEKAYGFYEKLSGKNI